MPYLVTEAMWLNHNGPAMVPEACQQQLLQSIRPVTPGPHSCDSEGSDQGLAQGVVPMLAEDRNDLVHVSNRRGIHMPLILKAAIGLTHVMQTSDDGKAVPLRGFEIVEPTKTGQADAQDRIVEQGPADGGDIQTVIYEWMPGNNAPAIISPKLCPCVQCRYILSLAAVFNQQTTSSHGLSPYSFQPGYLVVPIQCYDTTYRLLP